MSTKVYFEFEVAGHKCKIQGADSFGDKTYMAIGLFVQDSSGNYPKDAVVFTSVKNITGMIADEIDQEYYGHLAMFNEYIERVLVGGEVPDKPENGIERFFWLIQYGTELAENRLKFKQV